MQVLPLSAAGGWRWLSAGFGIFRKNHLMLTLLVISYWTLMAVVNMFPVIGTVVGTVCIPAFSVSLMNVCQSIDRGGPVSMPLLFSGFASHLRSLLVLGAIYLAATVGILAISSLFDDGALMRMILAGQKPEEESVASGALLTATQLALVLLGPLMMAYWYAPVLVGWHGFSPAKALFFSFVACVRNWRAFMVYALAIMAGATLLPLVVLGLFAALFPGATGVLTTVLTMAIVLIVMPTLYASFYVSYRDVFVSTDTRA
ncbi:MAG TPA: BPSS1780 family membrane protein [Accumulibacter sp.]|jgi:hypothetical protein|nr:BPSS1780 family membrane protein [Accumulibacter sp.]HQC81231.1 BPSS1780 family membrane protein [Accumulibacter sp.]